MQTEQFYCLAKLFDLVVKQFDTHAHIHFGERRSLLPRHQNDDNNHLAAETVMNIRVGVAARDGGDGERSPRFRRCLASFDSFSIRYGS